MTIDFDDFPKLNNIDVWKTLSTFDYDVWAPNAEVELFNVEWDSSYKHTVDWKTLDRDAWFDAETPIYKMFTTNMMKFDFNDYTAKVRLEIPRDSMKNKPNYLRVKQPSEPVPNGSSKCYHFFITDMQTITPNTTELVIQLDIWTQYINDAQITNLNLIRGHLPVAMQPTMQQFLMNPTENNYWLTAPEPTATNVGYSERAGNINLIPGNSTEDTQNNTNFWFCWVALRVDIRQLPTQVNNLPLFNYRLIGYKYDATATLSYRDACEDLTNFIREIPNAGASIINYGVFSGNFTNLDDSMIIYNFKGRNIYSPTDWNNNSRLIDYLLTTNFMLTPEQQKYTKFLTSQYTTIRYRNISTGVSHMFAPERISPNTRVELFFDIQLHLPDTSKVMIVDGETFLTDTYLIPMNTPLVNAQEYKSITEQNQRAAAHNEIDTTQSNALRDNTLQNATLLAINEAKVNSDLTEINQNVENQFYHQKNKLVNDNDAANSNIDANTDAKISADIFSTIGSSVGLAIAGKGIGAGGGVAAGAAITAGANLAGGIYNNATVAINSKALNSTNCENAYGLLSELKDETIRDNTQLRDNTIDQMTNTASNTSSVNVADINATASAGHQSVDAPYIDAQYVPGQNQSIFSYDDSAYHYENRIETYVYKAPADVMDNALRDFRRYGYVCNKVIGQVNELNLMLKGTYWLAQDVWVKGIGRYNEDIANIFTNGTTTWATPELVKTSLVGNL